MRRTLYPLWGAALGVATACGNSPPPLQPIVPMGPPVSSASASACVTESDEAPEPAYSGPPALLPEVPVLPNRPIKAGDDYTVFGALHHFRSRVHSSDVRTQEITVRGVVVKTNFNEAPPCAVHRAGRPDPQGCRAPVPAFWIADSEVEKSRALKVMGFAANWAQVYEAILAARARPPRTIQDEYFGIELPNPIPNVGAVVRVHGSYGYTYARGSGLENDPRNGILSYSSLDYVQPPPKPATLPGMR